VIKLKCNIYGLDGKVSGEVDLPEVFASEVRSDLIRKAFRAISLSKRQPYGSYPFAGMRRVGQNLGANHGVARLPRVSGGSRGVILASMVGGRSAHSPRSDKNLFLKINRKERILARRSAISGTAKRDLVKNRGHIVPDELTLPVVVDDRIETIKKTRDAVSFLRNIGVTEEIDRIKNGRKVRAGRGKMRGRRYRSPKGILIVTNNPKDLSAFRSIPGIEVTAPGGLSLTKLAPGGNPGRFAIFTSSAIKKLEEK
jgi:large subunit ribosomal protein L4e